MRRSCEILMIRGEYPRPGQNCEAGTQAKFAIRTFFGVVPSGYVVSACVGITHVRNRMVARRALSSRSLSAHPSGSYPAVIRIPHVWVCPRPEQGGGTAGTHVTCAFRIPCGVRGASRGEAGDDRGSCCAFRTPFTSIGRKKLRKSHKIPGFTSGHAAEGSAVRHGFCAAFISRNSLGGRGS
jgi:hypothetical protein